jgi:hypothetical protein
MAYTPLHVTTSSLPAAGLDGSPVPVILDCGERARVVMVTFSRPPEVGDRFDLEGIIWEIVRGKDRLRGYVARGLRSGPCVH